MGPVPFTASAEMFPLFIREVGMSFAVFVNLLGAGVIALVVQPLSKAIGHTGMLCLFMGLDLVGWALCYLFYPETARISLEELRVVFEVPLGAQARYRVMWLHYLFNYFVLWRKDEEQPDPIHIWYKERSQHKPTREEKLAEKKRRKDERRRAKDEKRAARRATQTQEVEIEQGSEEDLAGEATAQMRLELDKERTRNAALMRRIEELEQRASRALLNLDAAEAEQDAMGAGNSSTTFVPDREHRDHD